MDLLEDCNAWMWLKHDKYRVELNVGCFLEKLAGRRSRSGFLVDFGGWRLLLGGSGDPGSMLWEGWNFNGF